MIVATLNSDILSAKRVSEELNSKLIIFEERVFPDGEVIVKLKDVKQLSEEPIIFYVKLYPFSNEKIIKLIQSLDILDDYIKSPNITLVIPYLPYSRQDKRFLDGEPISLKTLLRLFNIFNIKKLITIDRHSTQKYENSINFPIINLSILKEIVKYTITKKIVSKNVVLISPDKGGFKRVAEVASEFDLEYTYLNKNRDRHTGQVTSSMTDRELVRGRDVIVLDDIISTGNSLIETATILNQSGANTIIAGASHLLLKKDADINLFNSGYSKIIGSNTIETKYSVIQIEKNIAESIDSHT